MPFLTLVRRGEVILRYPLTKADISVGRDPENDLQLSGETVSRSHCRLAWDGAAYRLTDVSRNGTMVNGTTVHGTIALAPKDQLAIGDWTLEYQGDALPPAQETVGTDHQPTLVLRFDPVEKTLSVENLCFTITPTNGVCQEVTANRLPISIGGAASNEIVVADDPYVSRTHCTIEQGPTGLILRDIGSRNGTWWKGARIVSQALPATGDFVIGRTHIAYRMVETTELVKPVRRRRCGEMLGASRAIQEVFGLVERIGPCDATVLVTGESGTGKELCARAIHAASHRASRAFVAINCGALPATIIESELFGHERGAFTGATSQHHGVFEQAAGGSLFLDEIGEMPAELQTRLLRVLETRTIRRIGGTSDIPVDCRLIAATHQDLQAAVQDGRFREDLYYRLYVIPINLPPLRERPEDLDLLIDHYCELFSTAGRRAECPTSARAALRRYQWPGNVRELRNTLQRALVLAGGAPIQPEHLVFAPARPERISGVQSLEDQERSAILTALTTHKGNHSQAARQLGIARTTLAAKIKKYGITPETIKPVAAR